jgi:hypothetical protein
VLAALIIVFREVFEAGLIVGIVLAVTGSVAHRFRWIGGCPYRKSNPLAVDRESGDAIARCLICAKLSSEQ